MKLRGMSVMYDVTFIDGTRNACEYAKTQADRKRQKYKQSKKQAQTSWTGSTS